LLLWPIIALATADEPSLEATAADAVNYFRNLEATWAQLTMAASTLGMIGSLWFFVAFGFLLRRAEGDPPWRSAIATLSGALLAALGLIGASWEAASPHGGRITPEVARLRVRLRQRRLREHMDRHGQFRRLFRLGDPLHSRARTLDGVVEGRSVAVVTPLVARAAAVHALGAQPEVIFHLDMAPLGRLLISRSD
jgi:hypothetical protein